MSTLFYIDGQPVSRIVAKQFFNEVIEMAIACGYIDRQEAANLWKAKGTSEEVRDMIHSLTSVHSSGGLEVVIELD